MRPEYFLVKVNFDRNGNPIREEYVDFINDQNIIAEAEANQAARRMRGDDSKEDIIEDAKDARRRRSIRPTVPEMPAASPGRYFINRPENCS